MFIFPGRGGANWYSWHLPNGIQISLHLSLSLSLSPPRSASPLPFFPAVSYVSTHAVRQQTGSCALTQQLPRWWLSEDEQLCSHVDIMARKHLHADGGFITFSRGHKYLSLTSTNYIFVYISVSFLGRRTRFCLNRLRLHNR